MPTPLTLTGKYQLVVFGDALNPDVQTSASRLIVAAQQAFDRLGVNPKFLLASTPANRAVKLDARMVTVVVFFGLSPSYQVNEPEKGELSRMLDDGTLIIPVVDSISEFSAFVPEEIAHLNGCSFADCGANFERLASRVLEGFGLLRERRRLFISYRRAETSGVASQLYEALDLAGFDVFLDTQGAIRPGEPFQELLWHRLADTDVAILLDSPGFLESRWTEEELARANNTNIQILQVLWPGRTEGAAAAFSVFHPLENHDFEHSAPSGPTAQLVHSCVNELVDEVEGLRARALGARHSYLVREFTREALSQGLKAFATLERSLILTTPSGERVMVTPAIGVPDSERYETLEQLHQRDVQQGAVYAQPPILLYDQTGIRARWLQHLGWLNAKIASSRSLSIGDAQEWLSELQKR